MATKVQFIVLDNNSQAQNKILCDLLSKYNKNSNKTIIYLLCPSKEHCYELDEFIINYQQENFETNFFPYQLITDEDPIGPIPPAPFCLGYKPNIELKFKLKYGLLINLHHTIPRDFLKYKEIIELVPNNEDLKTISREHFKHYSKYKCLIQTVTTTDCEAL